MSLCCCFLCLAKTEMQIHPVFIKKKPLNNRHLRPSMLRPSIQDANMTQVKVHAKCTQAAKRHSNGHYCSTYETRSNGLDYTMLMGSTANLYKCKPINNNTNNNGTDKFLYLCLTSKLPFSKHLKHVKGDALVSTKLKHHITMQSIIKMDLKMQLNTTCLGSYLEVFKRLE